VVTRPVPRALEELVVLASPQEPVRSVVDRMAQGTTRHFGVAVVVDPDGRVLGLFNNGDLLRLVARGATLDQPVADVMTADPVTASVDDDDEEMLQTTRLETWRRTGGAKELVTHVPVVDHDGRLVDVVDVKRLLTRSPRHGQHVEIHGLGYVGLTLAVALASRGHRVHGIDTDTELVARLVAGHPHFHEPRLAEMLVHALSAGTLTLSDTPPDTARRVLIVSVGTPVRDDGTIDDSALRSSVDAIGGRLRRGAIVLLRSTVPVGTTRELVVPLLEQRSGLVAGDDFHVAFTPERTAEGVAMQELTTLPQIVGGLTDACASLAGSFWLTLTDSVVQVDGLEAAEIVKLVNNSFRDLSFAFSNGVALLADRYNLDARRLINAANEGYPRNPVPRPSPGVGGYCLTKDPWLYGSVDPAAGHALLSAQGRAINADAARYPVGVLERWAARQGRAIDGLRVLLVGMAFKGWPATSDVRSSSSLVVAEELKARGCDLRVTDAVVDDATLVGLGLVPTGLDVALRDVDAVLILNNHPDNVVSGLLPALAGRPTLLFDGWGMLDRREVEDHDRITYATLGYLTPERHSA
jgi:UDP-N-acetyl-D-mannosaminuronic acid dehydrogenase